jgi:O-antigen ligase
MSQHIVKHGAAALVTGLPLFSLITGHGVGAFGFFFLGLALCFGRDGWRMLRRHWTRTRWVLAAFAAALALEVPYYLARQPDTFGGFDKPLRMLLSASAMLVVLLARPGRAALWRGAIGGALAAFFLAAWQRWGLGIERPGGLLNPITFGDLALCLGLLSLVAALDREATPRPYWPLAGALAGLGASLLSGSRGGWIVLVLAAWPLIRCRGQLPHAVAIGVMPLTLLLCGTAYLTPQTGLSRRVDAAVNDVGAYMQGSAAATSFSVRLELWKAGLMLTRQHPWTGQPTEAYQRQMRQWVAEGRISDTVLAPPVPPHLHNDALQALVTMGVPGLLSRAAILVAPLWFFGDALRRASTTGSARRALAASAAAASVAAPIQSSAACALAGLLLVLAYCCFGLTEVIFWSLKASLFYALMVFLLMGFCLAGADDPRAPGPPAPPAGPDVPGKGRGGRASRRRPLAAGWPAPPPTSAGG